MGQRLLFEKWAARKDEPHRGCVERRHTDNLQRVLRCGMALRVAEPKDVRMAKVLSVWVERGRLSISGELRRGHLRCAPGGRPALFVRVTLVKRLEAVRVEKVGV